MAKIYVDMDGTLAKWHSEKSIEEVASAGYFRSLEPIISVVNAIRELCKTEDVYILSSVFVDDHSINEKNEWLDKYLPEIPSKKRVFVPYGMDKSVYLHSYIGTEHTDILIDDFTQNLKQWHGIGIKVLNGMNNTHGTWNGYYISSSSTHVVISNSIRGIALTAA